ncbi:hypothetical protein [Paracoccus benzoatiresistens]|uniref:Uncharacterized protein n=1 Tax=Paracoccus benzoatiresistens TaxID=2997341 RepID=A0ABT4J7X2_9RHOB|nr:hypothetical protein [Paracoccus sp. EF6]MCZ0963228.1 hypothetical protein [Paracoccus sp. EF6]
MATAAGTATFSAAQHKKLEMPRCSIHTIVTRMALAAETSLIDLFLPLR